MKQKNSLTTQLELDSEGSMIIDKDFFNLVHELKNRLTVVYGGSQLVVVQLKQAIENYDMLKYIIPLEFLENLELISEAVVKVKEIINNIDDDYQLDGKKEP